MTDYYEPADYVKYWFIPILILKTICWAFGHKYLYSRTKKYCTRCGLFTIKDKGE